MAIYDERHVLALESEGRFFLLDVEKLRDRRLSISPPDFGLEALKAVSSEDAFHIVSRLHRLTDIAVNNDRLFVAYAYFNDRDECFTLRLALAHLDDPIEDIQIDANDWRVIAETSPCLPFTDHPVHPYGGHFSGGRMAIGGDGKIYLTTGTFGYNGIDGYDVAQDQQGHYGKVLQIDPDGGEAVVFTSGHRNPQGIAVDKQGHMWLTEQGPEGGDELNLLLEGSNYGWAEVTYGTQYGERTWPFNPRQGDHPNYSKPIYAWVPSIATSGLAVAEGLHPYWEGNLLVPTLKDRALHRVVLEGNRVVTMERIPIGERIGDIVVHNGYIILYCRSGNILRMTPQVPAENLKLVGLVEDLSPDARAILERCIVCHTRGQDHSAPNLCGIEDRQVAGGNYPDYSAALRSVGGVWHRARLDSYLANTANVVANGAMPNQAIVDSDVRTEVIDNLDYFCP